jgi:hypothetical protein
MTHEFWDKLLSLFFLVAADIIELDDWIARTGQNLFVIEHLAHIDNFRVCLELQKQLIGSILINLK